jgi:PAS domain S-box-containing protein
VSTNEENLLRSVALRNAQSIETARQRTESELRQAKEDLESKTQELARSLAILRATLDSTNDSILVTDGDGNILECNEHFVNLWQLPQAVLESRNHRKLLEHIAQQSADPRAFIARVEEIYSSALSEAFDVLYLVDGRVIERFSRIQRGSEPSQGRVWGLRDVTEQRQAEQSLREQAATLELLNETGTIIGSTLELESLLQAVTDSTTKLSGAEFGAFFYNTTDENGDSYMLYTLSGAPRQAFERFGQPRATPLFAPTFHGEGPIRLEDVLADPRYGKMAPHHGMPAGHLPVRSYLAMPVISRTGEVIGGLFFGHSRTGIFDEKVERIVVGIAAQAAVAIDNARLYEGLKKAAGEREKLLEAERNARSEAEHSNILKDEFLAILSHELRTPLNSILGWSQLLASGKVPAAETAQGLDAIQRSARAQTQLIEDLLDMSRIISGKIRLDVQWADLARLVTLAVESVRPSADSKQIRLRKIIDPHAGPVSGDPTRLQQIVWNLLINAIKFTPKGGKVDVLLERVNSHLEITVRDSGIGIKPEFLPQVFERFRQADSSTTRSHGGLGLGLSIVKTLVELHGGTIRAKSAGEHQGATFIVALPMAPVKKDESREHPTTPKPPAIESGEILLAGVKILVVDDEPDARELIKRVLSQGKAEILTAGSAEEGIQLLQAERPDVIISDIGMPGKDGYQFMREIRNLASRAGGKTPAIALTAFARSEDRTRAMIAGYQVHIAKPIEPQELVATVASLAGKMGPRSELPSWP